MIKLFFSLLLTFFPMIALADDTISFSPPTTDYSIGWLADIFGIVDGVLHGTGSQIVGRMFSVFNAAVMALGGIIITYTMLVSTMNTAHEGEMLGKKWSSIWVPVRATAGFALLVPKASGYCLLQVFVMWVVVQGVGAADKLWETALGYLNRGGVIIQAQQDPTKGLIGGGPEDQLKDGAISILSGQVCMLAVEKILKNKYEEYTNTSGGRVGTSKCSANLSGNTNLQAFCAAGSVPSFTDSLDFKRANDNSTPTQMMPNFDTTSYPFYSKFNGICGTINWSLMDAASLTALGKAGLTAGELETAKDARVIALQQMYSDLLLVARVMINNDPDPAFSSSTTTTSAPTRHSAPLNLMSSVQQAAANSASQSGPYKPWATDAFGEPLDQNNQPCAGSATANCTNWGTSTGGGALLNGTELVGAVLDYNGIIKPTLTLLAESNNGDAAANAKQFIEKAKASGWIMAGSYFFDLVKLNNLNVEASQSTSGDSGSGLNNSKFSLNLLSSGFPTTPSTNGFASCSSSTSPSTIFCNILEGNTALLNPIYSLFTGVPPPSTPNTVIVPSISSLPKVSSLKKGNAIPEITSTSNDANSAQSPSSVFGYAQNALVIQLPGQPSTPPLQFANMMHVDFSNTSFKMPPANFSCMGIDFLFVEFCIGRMIGNIIYNDIIILVLNTVTAWLESLVYGIVMNMLMLPLDAMASIFTQGVQILDVQGINPIIALAQMGTYYINFVGKLWFMLLFNQFVEYVLSIVGLPMVPIMLMAMPITIAWSLIMLGVGFITAYYVPIVPYMIFLFGSIAWFMAVIEAMVAAPIVALGVVHPEGHDIFGKGEAAIMILMNVFLRPAMMIIGFITAISLCYVSIWVLNAGFDRAINFIQSGQSQCDSGTNYAAMNAAAAASSAEGGGSLSNDKDAASAYSGAGCKLGTPNAAAGESYAGLGNPVPGAGTVSGGYTQWAGVFAFLFSILIYTTIYMTLVEKAFTLISSLPDNVLRWIGGQQERHGQEAASWAGDVKKGVEKAEGDSQKSMLQAGKATAAKAPKGSEGSIEASEK